MSNSTGQVALHLRTVREGNGGRIFTIGYERRDGNELVSLLRGAGVEMLADIREKPFLMLVLVQEQRPRI